MTVKIIFVDLTHTGQVVSANTFPLGVSMVAAYAKAQLADEIEFEVFRYPEDLGRHLETNTPRIACFSTFSWNIHLTHEYAKRIKAASPDTVCVFGGVQFPSVTEEQHRFLETWPAADFCVEGEGELVFVELFRALKAVDFDADALKRRREPLPNTCYLVDGEMVKGEMLPRIEDLNIVPSTFADGMSDKFFDDHLIPMIQTARGCPYACTFCHEGSLYFNKTRRFAQDRVTWELDYIAERVKVPDFIITDLNFGMFEADLDTTRHLAKLQNTKEWPKFVTIATAKNHKERVIEASHLLRGALNPGAPVQSTDAQVLKNIKRKNLPIDTAIKAIANTTQTDDASSFSEIILALPGDSKRAHFRSNFEIIETGISLLRNYQFMLLPGTEAATKESREKFAIQTRFRVKPMNFGVYEFRGESFLSAEIEEICIGNKTMTYEDYRSCRALDLTVEVFNNNGIFFDLLEFLVRRGVSRADFLKTVHDRAVGGDGVISDLYEDFRREEEKNLWEDEAALAAFVQKPGVIERYLEGEFGTNEIYKYRARAVFEQMEVLHEVAFAAARSLLSERGLDQAAAAYLTELARFSLARKRDFLDTERSEPARFHFDFVRLAESNFTIDPFELRRPEGVDLEIRHTDRQRRVIDGYLRQFGRTPIGLGRILNRAHISTMYRRAHYESEAARDGFQLPPLAVPSNGRAGADLTPR